MDRSLKWRTAALVAAVILCLCTLAPNVFSRKSLPTWFNHIFNKSINLGLDLQGGLHIVYSIDLEKAVGDKASEIQRDLESRFTDENIKAAVKTPNEPIGSVEVIFQPGFQNKTAQVKSEIMSDYGSIVAWTVCPAELGAGSLCFHVSDSYADSIKKAALTNAVSTIRERINEKGVAEPDVVEKDDDIIVELPGLNEESIAETKDIIARTAKLEMKVVDDCAKPGVNGCVAATGPHTGSPYMQKLFARVGSDPKGNPTDPDAKKLDIHAEIDQWRPDNGGDAHTDYYLRAYDRDEMVPVAWAKQHGKDACLKNPVENGKVKCTVTGREIIERYLYGDPDLGYVGLAQKDKTFQVPDDHQIGFELEEPPPEAKDQRKWWRTYYLESAVRLTGSAIQDATPTFDPNTNRPVVSLEFNRYGGRVFGDVTAQIAGMKFATILDDKVKSAPIINEAIRGGRAQITMGGSDATQQERERDDLVAVLKTGSLPAPLREETSSKLGPTLGRDAIQKTKLSFELGIVLVIFIMVGVYRWSGMIAVFALVFHIVTTLAVMAIFGATLTLPGIAAIVLSIGMEVDGNILIYERIREELVLGKSVRGAIDLGFSRAFSAILDGQLTTAAAGWVLLQYGSGPIKGFAVMLLVGVFTTLTTNIWVTRILFDWEVSRKKGQLQTLSI